MQLPQPLSLGRFRSHALSFGDGIFNRADHIESRFRQIVIIARTQALKAFNRVGKINQNTRRAGKDFSDMERL